MAIAPPRLLWLAGNRCLDTLGTPVTVVTHWGGDRTQVTDTWRDTLSPTGVFLGLDRS